MQINESIITESSHFYHDLVIAGSQHMLPGANRRRQQGSLGNSPLSDVDITPTQVAML